ncbi:hypothetical protein ABN028_21640 [Actinopolymorpha sp. B17G11]|uniref:phosphotransferase-like protein n=1 Tax=Actinopolymorpha sp. B17G11 TaxID=3160861 RepID=UPI0032E40622
MRDYSSASIRLRVEAGNPSLWLVAVRCAVGMLNELEVRRPEARPAGWAATQAVDIHDGLRFAAEVDTSTRSPDACADDVIAQLDLDVARPS